MHVVRLVSQPTEFDISCTVSSFSLTFDKIVHRKQILIRKRKEVDNSRPHDLMRTQVTRDHLFSPSRELLPQPLMKSILGFSPSLLLWNHVWSLVFHRINQCWPHEAPAIPGAMSMPFIPAQSVSSDFLHTLHPGFQPLASVMVECASHGLCWGGSDGPPVRHTAPVKT